MYTNRAETPLAFHKFFRYVSLPGSIIINFINIPKILNYALNDWMYIVDALFILVLISAAIVAFIGFFKWTKSSWFCALAYLLIWFVHNLYGLILYLVLPFPSGLGVTLVRFVTSLIWLICGGIYYKKRKPLFFNDFNEQQAAEGLQE